MVAKLFSLALLAAVGTLGVQSAKAYDNCAPGYPAARSYAPAGYYSNYSPTPTYVPAPRCEPVYSTRYQPVYSQPTYVPCPPPCPPQVVRCEPSRPVVVYQPAPVYYRPAPQYCAPAYPRRDSISISFGFGR